MFKDGHLLLDGCYVNNVPGDIMLKEQQQQQKQKHK